MASLAQVAGQYVFLLFNADGIGGNADQRLGACSSACCWIVLMTYICYVGIELSARLQQCLLAIELIVLLIFAVMALVKVGNGTARLAAHRRRGPGSTRSTSTRSPPSSAACC